MMNNINDNPNTIIMGNKEVMILDNNTLNIPEVLEWFINNFENDYVPLDGGYYINTACRNCSIDQYITILKKIRDNFVSIAKRVSSYFSYQPLLPDSKYVNITESELSIIISLLDDINKIMCNTVCWSQKNCAKSWIRANINNINIDQFIEYANKYDLWAEFSTIPELPREWLYDQRIEPYIYMDLVSFYNANITQEDIKNLDGDILAFIAGRDMSYKDFEENISPKFPEIAIRLFYKAIDSVIEYYENYL